jgi:hypothetical protein
MKFKKESSTNSRQRNRNFFNQEKQNRRTCVTGTEQADHNVYMSMESERVLKRLFLRNDFVIIYKYIILSKTYSSDSEKPTKYTRENFYHM